jgi:cytoskeletal protein RodZ
VSAKGVDLYRAERDTKIRARYLGALERGDYKELPGAVYTKGFLRNYALYLGLDPEDVSPNGVTSAATARNSRRRSSCRARSRRRARA